MSFNSGTSFNFEDFIPTFPEQNDPEIQSKVGHKKEFLDVAGEPSEPRPSPGELYRHQEAFKRFMINSDRMLNIQSVGTGKTCAMISVAEYYKKYRDVENIKRVYILVSGPSIKNEIKTQIACDCTLREYLDESVSDGSKDALTRKKALTRSIKKWYSILTYNGMVKEVLKVGLDKEKIEREFSGCIFLVDEAHYLNEKRKAEKSKEENFESLNLAGFTETDPDDEDKEQQYQILWKLFHSVKRSKIILSTATPMVNDVREIAELMNLLLPEDQQMPLKWNYDKVTISQLEPFFRGKVSYVRALETGADVEYEGVTMQQKYEMEFADDEENPPFLAMVRDENGNIISQPEQPTVKTQKKVYDSSTVIFPTYMSEFQKKSYLKAAQRTGDFRNDERQAASFVFPDGSYGGDFTEKRSGNEKASKYIKQISPENFELTEPLRNAIENLSKYSSKYDFIVRNELQAHQARLRGEIVGAAFIYGELVSGSGLILLGKILEQNGFERFNESNSVFQLSKSKIGNTEFCSSGKAEKVIKPNFQKKMRYGILRSGMSDEQRDALFEMFNSEQNANGDYCQILIGTPAAREGINVFNVLRGYLAVPGWHPAGVNQALARFVRSTSHNNLLRLIESKLLREGKDTNDAKVSIKVYKLASLLSDDEVKIGNILSDEDYNQLDSYNSANIPKSIDVDLYTTIEHKDIKIRRIMRMLKRCAFDCPIHHKRNVNPGDIDGTAVCDYNTCNYTCFPSNLTNNVKEEDIDYSTYEILYAGKLVEECKREIIKILSQRKSIGFEELYNHPNIKPIYRPKYVVMAVNDIIKEKRYLRNRFGIISFISMDTKRIFTQTAFPSYTDEMVLSSNSNNIYYKDTIFTYLKNNFDDLISILSVKDDKETLKSIQNLTDPFFTDRYDFDTLFNSLSKKTKLEQLEYSILEYELNGSNNPIVLIIIDKFKNYYQKRREPYRDIRRVKEYLETSNLRRGRNRKETACPIVNLEMEGETKDGEIVLIHKAEAAFAEVDSFKENAQFFNPDVIRIFKPSEKTDTWRNTLPEECQPYKNLIKMESENKIKDLMNKYEYIGTLLSGDKFRIIDTKKIDFTKTDKRSMSRGIDCTSFKKKYDLIEILNKSRYMPIEIKEIQIPEMNKEELAKLLINTYDVDRPLKELLKFSKEELEDIYRWNLSNLSKVEICNYVRLLFQEEDRIIFE